MRVLRAVVPNKFDMYGGSEILTTRSLALFALVPLAALYILTKRGNKRFLQLMDKKWARWCVLALPLVAAIALAVLARTGALSFDNDFGNGRGLTWRTGFQAYARTDWRQKLFGVGPDCFAEYLYSFPDLAAACREYFGEQTLKNAHSEMLTMLVNAGLVGVVAYLGIFVTAFARLVADGAKKPLLYILALCVFSYLLHNFFSFTQILNLPFVLLVMALGESYMRKKL
jgi:O-antigen ligase